MSCLRTGFGGILLVVAGGLFVQSMYLDRTGIRTPAQVILHTTRRSSSGGGRRGAPVIHLQYSDEQGRSHVLVHPDIPGIPPPTYVIYRPGKPEDPYVDGTNALFLPSFLCLGAAVLMFTWAWWPSDAPSGRRSSRRTRRHEA